MHALVQHLAKRRAGIALGVILALAIVVIGLAVERAEARSDASIQVVATTTLVGDVVRNVGGEQIDLTVLLPPNADPHVFELTPQNLRTLIRADVVFANGLGLEAFIEDAMASAGEEINLVHVSEGITPRRPAADGNDEDEGHDGEHEHGSVDPHVWMSPTNVQTWVDNIEATLSGLTPAHAATYAANAQAYRTALTDLDAWIFDRVTEVPQSNRKLVTDHDVWGYFAERYGFEFLGAVIPSLSTGAEPSARDIARLIEVIREHDVPAVFVGTTVSSRVAEQVAAETGVELVPVYTGSLSGPDGPAATYLDYMRYNVDAIVDALN
mgnify:CR=1 FL=1